MFKRYYLDTNILLDNPNCINVLRNGGDNEVIVPYTVLFELDKLKKNERVKHIVSKIVDDLLENFDYLTFLKNIDYDHENCDHEILSEIKAFRSTGTADYETFLTNDKLLQLFSKIHGITPDYFKGSLPFKSESEEYTGFLDDSDDGSIPNHFEFDGQGNPIFFGANNNIQKIDFNLEAWKVKPRNMHQNLAFYLMQNDDISLVSLQSQPGLGKTYLSLASALQQVFNECKYQKIYIIKPAVEIGEKLGFLPGEVKDKIEPYFRPIDELLLKLCLTKKAPIFHDDGITYDKNKLEVLPLNYMRGMNIDDGFVIIDEVQNISRNDLSSVLTRMGENVKCVAVGSANQVDNVHLNNMNNGLNWMVRFLKGQKEYAHLVLKGNKSRGKITDMCIRTEL